MTEPDWAFFVGVAILVTVALLILARLTHRRLAAGESAVSRVDDTRVEPSLSPGVLLGNVALSHGLLGGLLVSAGWYAGIPRSAWGLTSGFGGVALAVVIGVALYVANELAAGLAARWGIAHDDHLRELLAPDTRSGWVVLLGGVLPIVAGVEEVLFRAALIGVPAAGFGVSAWGLAVLSSVAFGLGHGLQGPGGIVVTGLLGFALATAFILTGSLLVVIVAHYIVNALEFVIHESFHVDPYDRLLAFR